MFGSCEEEYLNAVCANFKDCMALMFGAQRLSESCCKIEERERSSIQQMLWFGHEQPIPYNHPHSSLLEQYEPKNASHLISDRSSTNKDWYEFIRASGILYEGRATAS